MKVACIFPHSISPARMYFTRIANTDSELDRSILPRIDLIGRGLDDQLHSLTGLLTLALESLTLWGMHVRRSVVQVVEQLYKG